MSKRTFVCFTCRTTDRVPLPRRTRDCRICHAPAEHVYYKFRIPRRDDDTGWSELQDKVRDVNAKIKARAVAKLTADAERYTRLLASQPADRQSAVRHKLREIQTALAEWERWR